MEELAYGTLGYAGLPADRLLARAGAFFAQSEAPRRFNVFLPLFPRELIVNMPYLGVKRGARVAANGFSVDPTEYHARLSARDPELYQGDNRLRNFTYEGRYLGTGVFTVDETWADRFPQYRAFLGDQLCVYLIGGGAQAVAVPESVYPRGGGMLLAVEEALGVAEHAAGFADYARERVAAGEPYDADGFAQDYLAKENLTPFTFTQTELESAMQELSVLRSLRGNGDPAENFTRNARLCERVRQYVPMRYACDTFTPEALEPRTKRLAQLYFSDNDFLSDLWIPYADANACVDKRTMALDARALCEAFQIAPRYDPETGGARYPDAVRVAAVHDDQLLILTAPASNNPAYGNGQSPMGGVATHVCVPDSREQVRQRKLTLEKCPFTAGNFAVSPDDYRRMLSLATLQEHKGRLIDALYRRETALRLIDAGTQAYDKARTLLDKRAEKIGETVSREADALAGAPADGYDAQISYLHAMAEARENTAGFTCDEEQERAVEGGYAMRVSIVRKPYAQTETDAPETDADDGGDDALPDEEPAPETQNADTPET